MKLCRLCDAHIPDHARHCPHCRSRQRRREFLPQLTLVAAAGAVAVAALVESCPTAAGASVSDPDGIGLSIRGGQAVPDAPTIARLQYDGGGDWYANSSSLPNLLAEIRLRTGVSVGPRPTEVRLTDPDLRDFPYLYATGHGNLRFSEEELDALRRYLRSGGFLHVDDNYGLDESFRREVRRLFPDQALVEVPGDHAIYDLFYEFPDGLPKIHEHDGLPAQGLGIFLDGRLALFYSYQSDLGDGWEDAGVHDDPPEIRELAIRMGVNLFLYALGTGPGS